ncbi:MAG TPA: ABC transporter permease [Deferrisomatales bacterium]|nr:ABC transporter permease [Deferrisomatales bacterium]
MIGVRQWLRAAEAASPTQALAQRVYFGWLEFKSHRLAMVGLSVLAALLLMAVFAPWIATHDPLAQDLMIRLAGPSKEHWLGTDELGRDLFSRIVYGSRTTLYIMTVVASMIGPAGLLIGTVAGFLGGRVDALLMRVTDVFLAFPGLVLALAFVAVLGPGLENALIAISLTGWPGIARLARAETLTLRSRDFIHVIRLQGGSQLRIILRHIIPLCLPSVIVRLTLSMSGIILTAAGLGFLGLGARPPAPEWGSMLSTGRRFMLDHWWLAAMPGTAILLVSLACNLLGDGLRDVLDPRSKTG